MSESNVSKSYGYKLDQELWAVKILRFADYTVLVAKWKSDILTDKIVGQFQKIGLKLNIVESWFSVFQGSKICICFIGSVH